MKTKFIPDVVNILIRIVPSCKVSGDNRIKAIVMLKRIKLYESVILEARQPLINKYAKKNNKGQFLTINKVVNGKNVAEFIIDDADKEIYKIEMDEILNYDWEFTNDVKLFKKHEIDNILSFEEITILKDQKLLIDLE